MKKPSTHAYWEEQIRRKGAKCQHPDCLLPRYKLGRFCRDHSMNVYRYGHPVGKRIALGAYKTELKEVRELFNNNPNHVGLLEAVRLIDQIFLSGLTKISLEREWMTVHYHQVPPLEVLSRITAVYLYAWRNPKALPDDSRLTFALSRAAFQTAPQGKNIYRKNVVEATGILIRERLAAFLWHVCRSFELADEERQKRVEAFQQPWSIPSEEQKL